MREKGDTMFRELLNKITIGAVDVSVDYILNHDLYNKLKGSIHIFAKSDPANRDNECMLTTLTDRLIYIPAKDHIPKNCNFSDVLQAHNRKQRKDREISSVIKSQSQCISSDNKKILIYQTGSLVVK